MLKVKKCYNNILSYLQKYFCYCALKKCDQLFKKCNKDLKRISNNDLKIYFL